MTLRATVCADRRRNRILRSVKRLQDVVNAVTVGADRGAADTAGQSLTVNALHEYVDFGAMAFAAGVRNVDFRDGRLLIRSRLDVVTIMTIGANRRAHVAARNGFRVHALSIGKQRSIADAASLHDCLVTVTTAASLSDIRAIDG